MHNKDKIILIGPMGAGKSTIGKQLSKKLNIIFFDSDKEIEKSTGVNISWIFDVEGELGFRKREEKIICNLLKHNELILATGGGSIKSKKIRNAIIIKSFIVYLKTTIEDQISRTINDKKNRPLLYSKTEESYKNLLKLSLERDHLYEEIADIVISTNGRSSKFITNKIIKLINR